MLLFSFSFPWERIPSENNRERDHCSYSMLEYLFGLQADNVFGVDMTGKKECLTGCQRAQHNEQTTQVITSQN